MRRRTTKIRPSIWSYPTIEVSVTTCAPFLARIHFCGLCPFVSNSGNFSNLIICFYFKDPNYEGGGIKFRLNQEFEKAKLNRGYQWRSISWELVLACISLRYNREKEGYLVNLNRNYLNTIKHLQASANFPLSRSAGCKPKAEWRCPPEKLERFHLESEK